MLNLFVLFRSNGTGSFFVAVAYISKFSLRQIGGVKFDFFLTSDSSLFSSSSKYSHNLIFLKNLIYIIVKFEWVFLFWCRSKFETHH